MSDRSCWDDYVEMMTLLPEGNRQILAAIGNGIRKIADKFGAALSHATQREPEDQILP